MLVFLEGITTTQKSRFSYDFLWNSISLFLFKTNEGNANNKN